MKVSSSASRASHGRPRLSVPLGLAVSLFFFSGTTPVRASTAVTACGQVLSAAGNYELTSDLGPCQGDGVVITASGVHLTLAGHTITGVNPPSVCDFHRTKATQAGVRADGPFSDVRINGGTITGFENGIVLLGLSTSLLTQFAVTAMTVTESCALGIAAAVAQNGLVATSVVTGNGLDGIGLVGSNIGGVAPLIQDITVECNYIFGNARFGILNEGNSIIIRNNIVNGNAALFTGAGIAIFGNNNTIDRNSANNTNVPPGAVEAFGIILEQAVQGNTITGNTANGNTLGIDVELNASSNTTKGNIAHGNSTADLQDANPACGSNTWKGNNFDTANQGCIH